MDGFNDFPTEIAGYSWCKEAAISAHRLMMSSVWSCHAFPEIAEVASADFGGEILDADWIRRNTKPFSDYGLLVIVGLNSHWKRHWNKLAIAGILDAENSFVEFSIPRIPQPNKSRGS